MNVNSIGSVTPVRDDVRPIDSRTLLLLPTRDTHRAIHRKAPPGRPNIITGKNPLMKSPALDHRQKTVSDHR
jgi:hypothetical protein